MYFKSPLSTSNDFKSDYSSNYINDLWDDEDDSYVSSLESSCYDISKLEAHLYYFGIRGLRFLGPKLIFRTSKDVFTPPSDPQQNLRFMQLLPVYGHDKLGKDDLWATIRSEVVKLLDRLNIRHSSVDLVRFSWVEWNKVVKDIEDDGDDKDDNDITDDKSIVDIDTVVTTPVTIWVGVLPDTLTSKVAFHSSNDILDLLAEHGISDVDVAYRESVVRSFSGPELFAPVSDIDPLKDFIDPVTTALPLPIAGLKTLMSQGTTGFYFRVGKDLYTVTARHVLFHEDEGNNPYVYVDGPKKQVILMGTNAFDNFFSSIQTRISTKNHTLDILPKHIAAFTVRLQGGGPDAELAARELEKAQRDLNETQVAIEALKKFLVKIQKEWRKPKNRVIGHVVWAPPISFSTAPHGYTKDVCVIKLDEKKFLQNFRRNVLDLGPEISMVEFIESMNPRIDAFEYPFDRLLGLQGILSAEDIRTPNNTDHRLGHPMRYVIKRGSTSLTTVGCTTGFESHVRRYSTLGSCDSVEVAVLSYNNRPASLSDPFSRSGDSGSIIVDAHGKFVALLTSGTGPTDTPDITFGSPMHWLWDVIKDQFPGANLYFED